MNEIIFTVSSIAAILLIFISVASLLKPSFVFFPPPSRESWQYRIFWLLFRVMIIGLAVLSFTSYNDTPVFSYSVRFFIWLPLFILGFGLASYISLKLGWANAHGEAKGLVVSGWYKWSRNPIYVCSLFAMLGLGLFINSTYVYILLGLWAVMYIVAPFIEEKWLEKRYAQEFLSYKARVPRFFGIPGKT
ncbi:MAG: isoprenylcysteine carboxylmethyltransferase family protein [Gammaproteobacteria bacterium]|nr:isoprenylcysteine carboxylmethyltransferase family protein [Gammaproteobacteria bacterium]